MHRWIFQQQQVHLLFYVVELYTSEQGFLRALLHFLPWPTAPPRELWLSPLLTVLERINIFPTASECGCEMIVAVSMTLTYSLYKYNGTEGRDEEMLEQGALDIGSSCSFLIFFCRSEKDLSLCLGSPPHSPNLSPTPP